jgi:hypothetical protein
MTAPVALLTRNSFGALETVEPILACATGLPCEVCEAVNNCGMVDETWLEAREREKNLNKAKLADKLDLVAARMSATGRA